MDKVRKKLAEFFADRYGHDTFNQVLLYIALALLLIGIFTKYMIFNTLGLVIIIYVYFRMLSKNIPKRYEENQKFLKLTSPIRSRFNILKRRFRDRKTHKYLTCPNCKKTMRVPKGKGRIKVTCAHCTFTFETRS